MAGVMRWCSLMLMVSTLIARAEEPQQQLSLKLDGFSICEATTSVPGGLLGERGVSEWTIVTVTANSKDRFFGGAATHVVLFIGETPCFPVWRGLRLSCLAPRIQGIEKMNLWGPKEITIGPRMVPSSTLRAWRLRAEREAKVYPLAGTPLRPQLAARDLDELISKIQSAPEL